MNKLDSIQADLSHYVRRVDRVENELEATRMELHDVKEMLSSALERIEYMETENASWGTNKQDFDTALDAVVTQGEGAQTFEMASGGTTPRSELEHGALDQLGRDLDPLGQPSPGRPQGWGSAPGPSASSSFTFGDQQDLALTAARTPWSSAGTSPPSLGPQASGPDGLSRVPPAVADLRRQVDAALVQQ